MRALISAAMVMNACSTFVASLAEVSRKGMPSVSAYALASSVCTTFFEVRSHLLPTSILFTFSLAYRSISFIHCLTLLKDS